MAGDPLRRQLRFSIFLQATAAVMLSVACVVRIVTTGMDLLAVILGVGAALAGFLAVAIAWYLKTRLAPMSEPS